jgi:anti-sigma factor RsiW
MDARPASPTDTELSAWLDGALPPERQAEVGAWLDAHPEAAARVHQWAADAGWLRALTAPAADLPVPPRLRRLVLGHDVREGVGWRRAAVAAGWLLAGGALGVAGLWEWQRVGGGEEARGLGPAAPATAAATPAPWVQRAAYAHSVYTPEPRHAVEVGAQEDHLARWLTRRIDVPVKLFDLRAFGFELVGGRLLPDGAGKSAQLMYQDGQGVRVTVYLRKPEDGAPAAFRFERQGELGLFYWVEDGAGYALVGALPRERLLALAQAIYLQYPRLPDPLAPSSSAPGAGAAPAAPAGGSGARAGR